MTFAFRRDLLQLYGQISCTMTLMDGCDAKLTGNLQRDSKTCILCQPFVFASDGICFDVLLVAGLKEKFEQKSHLPRFFSIAVG